MATGSKAARLRWLGSAALGAVMASSVQAQSLPSGGTVTAGRATIAGGAGSVTVQQASSRAVIDWQSFDVGTGGKVVFQQPDARSAVLNRVTGGDISKIAGDISANGQIFLVNRNGVIVTSTGTVNAAGGFVASTLDISNDDFMAGHLRFAGTGGSVINGGSISGGAVALLGATVSNTGLIVSKLGSVALGSGRQATLDLSGDGVLQVALPADMTDANGTPLVSNSGSIAASGGMVLLKAATARTAVREAVNMSGVIRATGVSSGGGIVSLDGGAGGSVGISGTIDVSGIDGGQVDATGAAVAVDGGTILATGSRRGGLVRLGGAFQGGATTAPADEAARFSGRFGTPGALGTAANTSLDAASLIDVSGKLAGGTAVLWSSQATSQFGTIKAAGGAVELSSLGHVTTDLSKVAAGAGGMLLLDPRNIGVADDALFDGNGLVQSPLPAGGTVHYADVGAEPDTTYFKVGDIMGLMNAGTDVILKASNDIDWQASNAAVNFAFASGGHSGALTLSAGHSVSISGYLTLYSSNLTVIANASAADGVVNADRSASPASIDTYNAIISTQVGSSQIGGNIRFSLGTGAGLTNHDVAASNRIGGITSGGTLTFDASQQNANWAFFPATGPSDPIVVAAAGAASITGGIVADSSGGLTVSGRTVTWTDEATQPIGGISAGAPIAFVENGVTTRYGLTGAMDGETVTDLTRVSLGNGAAYAPITYGGTNPAVIPYHITSGSLQGGDTLAGLAADVNVTTAGLPAANASVGSYGIVTTAMPNTAGTVTGYFFNLANSTDTLRIAPKTLTPTITNGSYTYGAPTAVVSLGGIINGDVVAPVATLDAVAATTLATNGSGFGFAPGIAAGDHGFTLTGLSGTGAGNYTLDLGGTIAGTLAIARKTLTYQIGNASSVYGTMGVAPGATLTGVIGTDTVTLGGITSPGLSTTAGVGTYPLTGGTLGGTSAGNYVLATTGNTDATLTITPRSLTYVASGAAGVYGTAVSVAAPLLSGIVNGDVVAATPLANGVTAGFTDATPAGSYLVTAGLSGAAAGNYTIAASGNTTGLVTIARRPLTFSINDATGVYGSAIQVLTVNGLTSFDAISPLIQADGSPANVVSLSADTYGFAAAAGKHTFSFEGLQGDLSNYSFSLGSASRTGILTVTPKPITYSIDTTGQTFRDTAGAPTVTLSGLVYPDVGQISGLITANGNAISGPSDFFPLNAGSYELALSGLTGVGASNYVLASSGNSTGLRIVRPRTIGYTVQGDAASTYGTLATLPGAILTNIYQPDDVHGSLAILLNGMPISPTNRTNVGTYTIVVDGLTGTNAGNYLLGQTGNTLGQLTITTKPITYAIGSASSVYGQTVTVPTATLSGVVAGDLVDTTIGLSNGTEGGAVTPLPPVYSAGTFPLSVGPLTGAAAGNYRIATTGNTLGLITVTPKPITYRITSQSWVYGDGATVAGTVALDGLVNGDEVTTAVPVTASGGTIGVGLRVGSYAEMISGIAGPGASNYTLNLAGSNPGTITITPKPISAYVSLSVTDGTSYGVFQPNATFASASLQGLFATNVQPVFAPTALPASGAGLLKAGTYAFTVAGITGADAGNYTLAYSNRAVLTIVPKDVSSMSPDVRTVYGTTVPLTPTLGGVISGDMVGVGGVVLRGGSGPVAPTTQTSVGNYTIAVSTLTGADAADYMPDAGTGTLQIDRKTITANVVALTSVYGTLPTLTAPTLTGVVGNDDVQARYAASLSQPTLLSVPITDRLHVGDYGAALGLSGAAANNYLLAADSQAGILTVVPKTLGLSLAYSSISGTYGTVFAEPVQLQGVLPGDTVTVQQTAVLTARPALRPDLPGNVFALNAAALDVGSYAVVAPIAKGLVSLSGASAGDYRLPTTDTGKVTTLAQITVSPRALSYTLGGGGTASYGTTPSFPIAIRDTLVGLPLDYTLMAVAVGSSVDLGRGGTYNGASVGTYTVAPQLTGASAYDYTLIGASVGYTVTPRALTYRITGAGSSVYGSTAGLGLSFDNVVAGLPLDYTVVASSGGTTVDLGQAMDYARTPAGTYSVVPRLLNASSSNYTLSGAAAALAVTPKPLTATLNGMTVVYGSTLADLVTMPGVLAGDTVAPVVTIAGQATTLAAGGVGAYGIPAVTTDVGMQTVSFTGLSGAQAGNYGIANAVIGSQLTVTPKPITYSVAAVTGQYGGITQPSSLCGGNFGCALSTTSATFTTGAATLNGVLDSDRGFLGSTVLLFDGSRSFAYAANTPVGDYLQVVSGLTGSKAANYTIAPSGNATGIMSIQQASIEATISGGGRVYDAGSLTSFTTVGTPGVATITRSFNNGAAVTGFLPGDDVSVVVTAYKDGVPYTGDAAFPVGDYQFIATSLIGAQAANYRLGGNTPGAFNVVDSSIFGFAFLTTTPTAAYTPPTSVTTFTPNTPDAPHAASNASALQSGLYSTVNESVTASTSVGNRSTFGTITATGGLDAGATASTTQTALSFAATASADVNAQGSVSAGLASLSSQVGAGVQSMASFGLTSINVAGSAYAGTSVTLTIGPVAISYGAGASAEGTGTLDRTGLEVTGQARVDVNQTLDVSGELGGGVSGSASESAELFAETKGSAKAGVKDGALNIALDTWAGVGASAGGTASVSGSGISGSASVKVYSPGTVGLGLEGHSGYSNGTVTIGFDLGLAIGIGGLKISPEISFDTSNFVDGFVGVFTGSIFNTDRCNAACGSARAAAAQKASDDALLAKLASLAPKEYAGGTMANLAMVEFIAANPHVLEVAQAHWDAHDMSGPIDPGRILQTNRLYADTPARLSDIVTQERALAMRLRQNPASLTAGDIQQAESLRNQEKSLIAKVGQLGATVAVADGKISIVTAPVPTSAGQAAVPSLGGTR
jgi:filamentous hemagglutinin family protein